MHPLLVPPDRGGPGWSAVESGHFVLRTDLDARTAERASIELERMYAALAELGFPSEDQPSTPIDVVYFRSRADYVVFGPPLTAGIFLEDGRHDFETRPLAILGGDFGAAARATLLHELAHRFAHYYYPQAPRWLDEGLARYLETMTLEGDTVVLGRQPARERFWNGPLSFRSSAGGEGTALLPASQAPALAELRAMSPRAFYGDAGLDPRASDGRRAAQSMAIHYAAAWTLVHLLLDDPTYAPIFAKYLARIHEGMPESAAWQGTLGEVPARALEAAYRASLVPKEVNVTRGRWEAPSLAPEARPMTPSEVRALWARLRPSTPEGRAAAIADLEAAKEIDAHGGEPALVQAAWMAEGGDIPGAQAIVRAALRASPEDARLWNALGRLTMNVASSASGHLSEKGRATLDEVATHLAPVAQTAAQNDLLARIYALQGKPDAALAREHRAVADDPNCVPCLAEAALVFFEKGDMRQALATGTLAQGLLPEGRRMRSLDELVDLVRARLASGPATSR